MYSSAPDEPDGLLRNHPWPYGDPSPRNANFAWLQHVVTTLNGGGRAAVLMANNACFSSSANDRKIRAAMVEGGVVACLVAMPSQLFAGTAVPTTLWVLGREARHPAEILFIDATSMGQMVSRTLRVLSDDELSELEEIFRLWWRSGQAAPRGDARARRVTLAEIREHGYSLNPLSYVGQRREVVGTQGQLRLANQISADLRKSRIRAVEVSRNTAASVQVEYHSVSGHRSRTRTAIIGDVPHDWEEVPLGRLAEIQAGSHATKSELASDGIPIVHPRDLRDGWVAGDQIKYVHASKEAIRRYGLVPGDVLCVRAGELGRYGLVDTDQAGWLFGAGLLRVRPAGGVLPNYLAHYLGLTEVRDWTRRHASGTAVPGINRETLAELPVVLPPLRVQRGIGRMMDLLQEEARIHDQLTRLSVRHRQVLGPLLMTGMVPPTA